MQRHQTTHNTEAASDKLCAEAQDTSNDVSLVVGMIFYLTISITNYFF